MFLYLWILHIPTTPFHTPLRTLNPVHYINPQHTNTNIPRTPDLRRHPTTVETSQTLRRLHSLHSLLSLYSLHSHIRTLVKSEQCKSSYYYAYPLHHNSVINTMCMHDILTLNNLIYITYVLMFNRVCVCVCVCVRACVRACVRVKQLLYIVHCLAWHNVSLHCSTRSSSLWDNVENVEDHSYIT